MKNTHFIPTMILHNFDHINQLPNPMKFPTRTLPYNTHANPYVAAAPKTMAGFARAPIAQRKNATDNRNIDLPEIGEILFIPITIIIPYTRYKLKKRLNKHAIREHFHNPIIESVGDDEIWLDDVVFELEQAEKLKTAKQATNEEIREFVESILPNEADKYTDVINKAKQQQLITEKQNRDFERLMNQKRSNNVNRIANNEFIADHFIKTHHGADTTNALHTLEKYKVAKARLYSVKGENMK